MEKLEGTSLTETVEVCKLKRADILLVHAKGSLWGWLIRFGTRSYWNHALMVYEVRNPSQGYDRTLTIDPKTFGGIEIDNIAHYLERPKKYDVAVKRLDTGWFQKASEGDKRYYRSRVCDIALSEIDNKHGWILMWRLFRKILRQTTIVYRFVRHKIKTTKRRVRLPRIVKPLNGSIYTCSGFVQWCYYQGVSRVLDEEGVDKSRLQEVVFNPRLAGQATQCDLLSTTPADLANCDKLSWKYVIKDGAIWEVSSEEEVSSIIKSGKKLI